MIRQRLFLLFEMKILQTDQDGQKIILICDFKAGEIGKLFQPVAYCIVMHI